MELEKVLSVDDGPRRKVIRFVRDDARVPFEVPDSRAVKGCLFRGRQRFGVRRSFTWWAHIETIAAVSANAATTHERVVDRQASVPNRSICPSTSPRGGVRLSRQDECMPKREAEQQHGLSSRVYVPILREIVRRN